MWLWIVFFLQGMAPGFWMPAITNILKAQGLGSWVAVVFIVPPLCSLISPLIGGALADQRLAANRLFAWTSLLGSGSLLAAFACLHAGWNPWWFVGLLGLYSGFSGPAWGLLTTIALTHLSEDQMRVIELSFFDEKAHAEIAQTLQIPLGTVKSRMRLAMNRLRGLLGDLS